MKSEVAINRAKTALSRNTFSRPVQHLLERGVLTRKRSFFDYGCGRGDDVAGLRELGFDALGWDPAFHPTTELTSASIVNLGFVLNVIEDPKERVQALQKAWSLAEDMLIVTVISVWERPSEGLVEHSDGHVTQRSTFQRYYEPGEIKHYVDDALGIDSVPASPMCVVCFKQADAELEYIARTNGRAALTVPAPVHPLRKSRLNQCIEEFRTSSPDEWLGFASSVTEYACPPSVAAVAVNPMLVDCGVKPSDILRAFVDLFGEEDWAQITRRAQNQLLSRIALAFFRGKPRAKHYTRLEREAIKYHFDSFRAAFDAAQRTLYSIGDPQTIERECADVPFGVQDEQALYVHQSCLPELSPVLQTYIGVGRLFYGELSDVDIFKIHKASGKLTLLLYDDFETADEPVLHTRVKISFRARRIDYFDHSDDGQVLHNKRSYMST